MSNRNVGQLEDDLRVLRRMQALLRDETHWVKGVYAANCNGESVDLRSAIAKKFCIVGAYMSVIQGGRVRREKVCRFAKEVFGLKDENALIGFNDREGYAAVVKLMREAEESLRMRLLAMKS